MDFTPVSQRIQDSGTTQRQGNAGDPNEAHLLMDPIPDPFVQNMFVLCHGEEVTSTDIDAGAQAGARPWSDPPLTARGKQQAWRVGRKIKLEGWNVTRVVVSPSLRCVQTAVEVVAGLSTMPSGVQMRDRDHGYPDSDSSIKQQQQQQQGSCESSCDKQDHQHCFLNPQRNLLVCEKAFIECGLGENLMNQQAGILPRRPEVEDTDWLQPAWTLDLTELTSMLPTEIQDPAFQPIQRKLLQFRENTEDNRCSYTSALEEIANRYLHENLLFITHGEGVRQSVSMMWPHTQVNKVRHCAYVHAQRPIFEGDNGDWELLTESGSSSGIFLRELNELPPKPHVLSYNY